MARLSERPHDPTDARVRSRTDDLLLVRALRSHLQRFGDLRGQIAFELARILHENLGDAAEAWPYALAAVTAAPNAVGFFSLAETLALEVGKTAELIEALSQVAAGFEDAGDRSTAAELFACAAELTARTDPSAAARILERIRELGANSDRILALLDELYGRLGDEEQRLEIVEARVAASHDVRIRRQCLYRLAEFRLKHRDTLALACDFLSEAAADDSEQVTLRALLRRSTDAFPDESRLVRMWEDAARASADPASLADALEKVWGLDNSELQPLRESLALCRQISSAGSGADHTASLMLTRVLERAGQDNVRVRAWALKELADCSASDGNDTRARELLREAASFEEPEARKELLLVVAERALREQAEQVATEIYTEIFDADPTEMRAFTPLATLYRSQGRKEQLAELLAVAAEQENSPEQRAALRFERATLLREVGRAPDIVARALEEILEDDPSREDVAHELALIYQVSQQTDALEALYVRLFDTASLQKNISSMLLFGEKIADIRSAAGRHDEAAKTLRDLLEVFPTSEPLLLRLVEMGRKDTGSVNYGEYLERLVRMKEGPGAAPLALELSLLCEREGDDSAALRALEIGYRAAPTSEPLREKLEASYRDRGAWFKLATLYVDEAGRRSVPGEKCHLLRQAARLYEEKLRDPRRAEATLREAFSLMPDDLEVLEELIAALVSAGDSAAAELELTHVLERDSGATIAGARIVLLTRRAQIYAANGKFEDAIADLEVALAAGGDCSGEMRRTLERGRESASLRGAHDELRRMELRLAECAIAADDVEGARVLVGALLERSSEDREGLSLYAWLAERTGNHDEALSVLRRLIAIEEGDALLTVVNRLVDACERMGRPQEAQSALERARTMLPDDVSIRVRLSALYEQTGQAMELGFVLSELSQLASDTNEKFQYLVRAGTVLLDQGTEPERSLPLLEEALALKSGDLDVVALLADAYTATGRARDASEILTRAIGAHRGKRSRELGTLHHRLARVAQLEGDRPSEIQSLATALDMDPQNGYAASELAVAAMEMGQWDVAGRALRAVTMLKTEAPLSRAAAYKHLGEIAYQQGDSKRAAVMLKRAIDEDPSMDDARALLQQLQ